MRVEQRIRKLVERFEAIGEETMRGLPLVNTALAVEAVGFERHGDDLVGALITPWFINVVALPATPSAYEEARIGDASVVALPGGETSFTRGGDAAIGSYRTHPVRTSTIDVESQEHARRLAREALDALRTESSPESPRWPLRTWGR
jgi:[NiFe] hydrogenase assembly HybE family chaperone